MDRTLANGKQCLISYEKQISSRVERPVHLNAFILAYSKVIMNNFIEGFGGFDDWNNTFYYTNTDSLHLHHDQVLELTKNKSDSIGTDLGQLHDDIEEVNDGKIITSYFLAPKLYIDVILGFIKKVDKEIGYDKAKEEFKNAKGWKKEDWKKIMDELESKRKLGIAFHIRAKGVQKSSIKPLKFEQFK